MQNAHTLSNQMQNAHTKCTDSEQFMTADEDRIEKGGINTRVCRAACCCVIERVGVVV